MRRDLLEGKTYILFRTYILRYCGGFFTGQYTLLLLMEGLKTLVNCVLKVRRAFSLQDEIHCKSKICSQERFLEAFFVTFLFWPFWFQLKRKIIRTSSGSDQSISHTKPWSGTSRGRSMFCNCKNQNNDVHIHSI